MDEMKTVEVRTIENGTVKMNQDTVQAVGEQFTPKVPASPYVRDEYRNRFAEQVPPTVKRFRENFAIFGTSALLFGICFTACFFKARIGISYPVFVLAAIALVQFVAGNLINLRERVDKDEAMEGIEVSLPSAASENGNCCKKAERRRILLAVPYYIAAFLIAVSVAFTAKSGMHFISTVAIILLLEVAFLELLFSGTNKERNFEERCKELLLLPSNAIANCIAGLLDGLGFFRRMKFFRNEKVRHILLGVLIAIPLLIVVFALLASADMIFSSWTETVLDHIFFSANPYQACLLTVAIYVVTYGIMAAASRMMAPKRGMAQVDGTEKTKENGNQLTAITVTMLLTLVYLLFSGIQLFFLFGGGKVSLPDGFTYAEYARQGFFQLLAVTFINILILMFCRKPAGKSLFLRVVLTVFSACTYVMIASAAMRMLLYIDAYSLSFLRILVLWFLAINSLLVSGIILTVYHPRFPLFRYIVAVTAICYIALAYINVDYRIASYNLSSRTSMTETDLGYLSELSEDAAPVLVPVFAEAGSNRDMELIRALKPYVRRLAWEQEENNEDFRSFNISRYRAGKLLESYGLWGYEPASLTVVNRSGAEVFSVGYDIGSQTLGGAHADNTPIDFGESFVFVDEEDCFMLEDGIVIAYDRKWDKIASFVIPAERFMDNTRPDGKSVCVILEETNEGEYEFRMVNNEQ